jgi:HlyD family secretion protein
VGVLYFSGQLISTPSKKENIETITVDRGLILLSINATGVVDSENEVVILSPGPGIVQGIFAEPGSRVKKDQVIMQLNTESVREDIEKLRDQIDVRKNNLDRTRLNSQSTRLDLDYNEEVKKLRIASLKSQLSDQEQLLEVGGISPARIDQTKQEIILAEKDLQTLVERNYIRLKQLEAEEEGLLMQIRMQQKEVEEKQKLIERMTIKAPSSGIILSVSGRAGEKVGNDNVLIRISDLSSFKVIGSIEEQHAHLLKTGNRVIVNLDDESMEGTVGNITPVVRNNQIQFNVHLSESSHPKLIANQQVGIQIISNFKEDALRLKKFAGCETSQVQKLFVLNGNKAVKREFTMGIVGNEYIEILTGLQEGDVVVTDGLSAFHHLEEVELYN